MLALTAIKAAMQIKPMNESQIVLNIVFPHKRTTPPSEARSGFPIVEKSIIQAQLERFDNAQGPFLAGYPKERHSLSSV
jgi:hypothetical protein